MPDDKTKVQKKKQQQKKQEVKTKSTKMTEINKLWMLGSKLTELNREDLL